jgi:hypothetical protein
MRPDRRRREPRHRLGGWRRASARAWDVDPARADPGQFDGPVIPLHAAIGDLEPELAALSAELAIAGSRALAASAAMSAPAPEFAAALRERLVGQLPQPAPSGPATGPRDATIAVPVAHPVRSSLFDQLAAPRWTALTAAAVIVFAAIGLTTDRVVPVPPGAHVAAASAASIRHGGSERAAAAGATIGAGDTVAVAAGGEAILVIGGSEARLDGGATVELDRLDSRGIELIQLTGHAYHRVDVPSGASYLVRTASITWTAQGTAFDVDREVVDGAEQVTVLAVQHAVGIEGPDLTGSVLEGRRAVVRLGGELPDVAIGDADVASLHDPWLIANARRDRDEGRPLGILAGLDLGAPSASPSALDSPSDVAGPSDDADPDASAPAQSPDAPPRATAKPAATAEPTPKPTPPPTPKPTPRPDPTPAGLGLTALACDGGVVLTRSVYGGDGFAKAVVLQSASESIPAAWPPGDGSTTVATASTTNASKTDGFQLTADGGGTSFYRALILGASNQVLAASAVRSVTTHATEALGELSASADAGGMTLGWTPFGGPADCFTTYKAVWSETSPSPSYLGEHDGAVAVGGEATSGAHVDGFTSGQSYHVRVQAIRMTSLGAFVVAQTGVTDVTMP